MSDLRIMVLKMGQDLRSLMTPMLDTIEYKRWIVEHTCGWLIQSERLIRDYELKIEHSEAMIYLSMSKRMLAKITR